MSNKNRKTNRKNNVGGSLIKNFVLDTNVLIQDASALVNFAEHNVWVPHEVLEELDGFKRENDDRGYQAREAFRLIDQILPDTASVKRGYTKPAGGTVRFVRPNPKATKTLSTEFPDLEKADNRILAAALSLKLRGFKNVIMVSKDGNVRTKARILDLGAEDLQRDKVHEKELKPQSELVEMALADSQIQAMMSTGEIQIDPAETADLDKDFVTYLVFTNVDKPGKTVPARYLGKGRFRKLRTDKIAIRGGREIGPKNLEQVFLFDALRDPTVTLITVDGNAGTGKTIASIGCGLFQVQEGHYDKLLVGRAIMPQGNDVGFLPGSKDEKLASWVRPAIDNIEYLMPQRRRPEDNGPQFANKRQSQRKQKPQQQHYQQGGELGRELRPHERLIKEGLLELEILARIRGASISNAFFVADEVQNLNRLQAKTLVTRMGFNSKLVMVGDRDQIDAPYVDRLSNGLAHTIVSMRGDPEHVHITLRKGERSRLAEAAAKRM